MKKILWFSRHEMTTEQKAALGAEVEIVQVNKSIQSARELQAEMDECDIIAIVAPIGLQSEFLRLAGGKPVIVALSERVLVADPEGGEDKVNFVFRKWERLVKIEVVKEDFTL